MPKLYFILVMILKWCYDQKIISFFSSDFEKRVRLTPNWQNLSFEFYPKAVCFECKFWSGPPLLTFKTDRLDLRGLDLEKMTSFTH